jgi:hypothetical protein
LSVSRQQSCHASKDPAPKRLRQVSFANPVATFMQPPHLRPPPAPPNRAARSRRSTARPARYTA